MNDFEKNRAQSDARRAVVRRRAGSSVVAEQAIVRHLGIELYRERRQAEHPRDDAGNQAAEEPEASTDR